ncbi:unnamed protein product [Ectocarpus fasciculatus]
MWHSWHVLCSVPRRVVLSPLHALRLSHVARPPRAARVEKQRAHANHVESAMHTDEW